MERRSPIFYAGKQRSQGRPGQDDHFRLDDSRSGTHTHDNLERVNCRPALHAAYDAPHHGIYGKVLIPIWFRRKTVDGNREAKQIDGRAQP